MRAFVPSLLLAVVLGGGASLQAARVSLGTASAPPGGAATLELTFSPEGSQVSTLKLDLQVPATLTFVSASPGAVTTEAEKSLQALAIPGGVRLLVYGLNQTPLGAGVVGRIALSVAATASAGTVAVGTANASAGDPSGNAVTLTASAGSVTVTGSSSGATGSLLVPVVLSAGGAAGSFYTTELTLTNRASADANLTLTYTAASGGGSGTAPDRLAAGRQRIVPDAIEYLRSLGVPIPSSGSRLGTLRIGIAGASASQVAVTARTATVVPEGRAGLAYAAIPESALLTGGAWISGLRRNAQDRSNLALVNAGKEGDGDVRFRITVRSGNLAAPGSGSFETDPLGPGGFLQLGIDDVLSRAGLPAGDANAFVRVERSSGSAPFTAYGVVNDQLNSDGSFIVPVPERALDGKTALFLPVVVESAAFTSELVLTNVGTSRKTVQLTFVSSAVTSSGNAAVDTLALEPGEQRVIPSFVQYLRSRGVAGVGPAGPGFAGAVFASVPGGDVSSLLLGARTSAPGSVKGRYGLYYAAIPSGGSATGSAWLFGLQQNGENRTNVAFLSTGEADGSAIRLRVELFDGDTGRTVATIEGSETTLEARRWSQIGTILASYAAGTTNAYARVSRVSGANPFVAYAVINDGGAPGQRSGDGAYLPMSVE